jgi:tetratricopeptide (TPR) repeat protein
MPWLLSEYMLKGVYLGLLLFVALQDPSWTATFHVALFTFGGLALALVVAAGQKLREGYRVTGRLPAFVLFLLLENPGLIYAGLLLGLAIGALWIRAPGRENGLVAAVLGGVGVGVAFWALRHVRHRWVRFGLGMALAIALGAGTLGLFYFAPEFLDTPEARTAFGARLLLGIPVFYLLTLAGAAEESEVEIGAIAAALGLGSWMLTRGNVTSQAIALVLPVVLYSVYTTRILPGLRVFKHTIRGISHGNMGRYRPALLSFGRALELDAGNTLARESLWSLHRAMDLNQILADPQTLALVNLDLCLERASSLLLAPSPTPAKLQEARHLLDLVLNQRPAMKPVIDYWRAVAATHAKLFDDAAGHLQQVVEPSQGPPDDAHRNSVLFPAWQLALSLHPEMKRRVGVPQLALPGRRMEAIAAVERQLAGNTEDGSAWELKRLLYGDLTEAEYKAAAGPDQAAANFDHGYVEQLGLALIDDPARWQRGVEFLRLAARGLPQHAPGLFIQIANTLKRAHQADAVWNYFELAKRAGQAVGPRTLPDKERQEFFAVVKLLAEHERDRGNLDLAIDDYHLYSEFERSGLETLRTLAQLYEEKGDSLGALRIVDKALVYEPRDNDLLSRKERYYYSVMPEQLRSNVEAFGPGFDVAYCLRKAKSLLDFKDADLDLIDWAQHLLELAMVVKPADIQARVLKARALRRRGEIEAARAVLEEVYHGKPEKFASGGDEDAWYLAARLLGEMYLYELSKPDLAVACFLDFRQSSRSGADTMYKLGQAYEQLGDRARASKYYQNVTAYDGHPLASDAREALYRLQSAS